MKINTPNSCVALAILLSGPIFCWPAQGQSVNPVNGLPLYSSASVGGIDPATGLLRGTQLNATHSLPPPSDQETPMTAVAAASRTQSEVHDLIFNGRYEAALQALLAYHDQFKTRAPLTVVLPEWIELGRRFPEARAALVKIRDHAIQEFAEGRGFCDLFVEINSIDRALYQDDVTYGLFKTFRDKDPDLAQQCYPTMEPILMSKGEYQWCYDHMGDPESRFQQACQMYGMEITNQLRMARMRQQSEQRRLEWNQQHGLTNRLFFSPPDMSDHLRKMSEAGFIGQTLQIIEILVATGHKQDAEKIRDEAVVILDDPRLRSAVSYAVEKTQVDRDKN